MIISLAVTSSYLPGSILLFLNNNANCFLARRYCVLVGSIGLLLCPSKGRVAWVNCTLFVQFLVLFSVFIILDSIAFLVILAIFSNTFIRSSTWALAPDEVATNSQKAFKFINNWMSDVVLGF